MSEKKRWYLILGTICIVIAIAMQVPQVLHQLHPNARGLPVHLNSDEHIYLARVQEGLEGRPENAGQPFVSDASITGLQAASIEQWYGHLFEWTGWSAAEVLQVLDSVVPPLLFLVLWCFLVLCGFTKRQALFGASIFVVISLYNLNRPVYQRASTLVTLAGLMGVFMGLRYRWYYGVIGGFVIGSLIGVYFWSFTFAWAYCGLLVLWAAASAFRSGDQRTIKSLILFGAAALVAALPLLVDLWGVLHHPLYEAGQFRSGIHPGRVPESIPYSVLFGVMFFSVLVEHRKNSKEMQKCIFASLMVITAFVVINQQVIHGVIFNYVSHYMFLMEIAAISMLLLWHTRRTKMLLIGALAACVYLAAIAYDGRFVLKQWHVNERRFSEQQFATLLPVLAELPRTTILTDPGGALFIPANTKHDVVWNLYMKNTLISNEELAERFCLTLAPLSPEERDLENNTLIYPDAVGAFGAEVRAQEIATVTKACERIDADLPSALGHFGVLYVLWDETHAPQWDLRRLNIDVYEVARDEGWSLWKVGP